MVFKLVGCGLNAHSQLQLSMPRDDQNLDPFPGDIYLPRELLVGESLKLLYVGWSDLIFEKDSSIYWHGAQGSGKLDETVLLIEGDMQLVGNHSGPYCAISKSQDIFLYISGEGAGARFIREPNLGNDISHIAVAGNGRVCVVRDGSRVFEHIDFKAFLALKTQERIWNIPTKRIVQLVANESSFSLLTAEGQVYTWGDMRYSLGRDVTKEEPATEPSIIQGLEGLRMCKISTGGWLGAALSDAQDLYIWGQLGPGGGDPDAALEHLPGSSCEVGLVDLGDEVNILDVALGAGHICVLTEGGDVYTAGRNDSGQTGIAGEGKYQSSWKKWGRQWVGSAKAVYSGPFSCNTFLVIESQ